MNYVMDGQDPVFRTARGSKPSDGQNVVAFEANNEYDERTRSGWSVLANGRAHAIYEEAEIQCGSRLLLLRRNGSAPRTVRSGSGSRPASISGRRIPGPEAG